MFRINRCAAAGASRGDGLLVVVIHQVTAGKDAGQGGLGRRLLHDDVASLIGGHLALEEAGARVMANRYKHGGDIEFAGFAG